MIEGIIFGFITYCIMEILRLKFVSLSYLFYKKTNKIIYDKYYDEFLTYIQKASSGGNYIATIELDRSTISSPIVKQVIKQLELEDFDVEIQEDKLIIFWNK